MKAVPVTTVIEDWLSEHSHFMEGPWGYTGWFATPTPEQVADLARRLEESLWYSMAEEKPNGSRNGGWYYVCTSKGTRLHALWSNGEWFAWDDVMSTGTHPFHPTDDPITHWRLLPAEPAIQETDNEQ